MKKNRNVISFIILLFIVGFNFSSCEGPAGADGPIGPEGPKGEQGEQGEQGEKGDDGNANVVIIKLSSADITWVAGSYLGRTSNTFALTNSSINQDIIDNGTVIGYCFLSSQWFPLPFTWENSSGTLRQFILYSYALNTINLYAYDSSGVLDPGAITEYRFLLITDNTVTSSTSSTTKASQMSIIEKMEHEGVNIDNYSDVCAYLNINEE